MKKTFFVLWIFLSMTGIQAQEKGLHLKIDGGLGWTDYLYNIDGGSHAGRLGYGGSFGVQYFFNKHWGISVAGELFVYNTQSRYSNKSFLFKDQMDDEGDIYDLTIRLKNWKENQKTTFLEIPVMAMYQHKFGTKERHGLYFGLGIKAQIPLNSTFERGDGVVGISAFYPEWGLPLGEEGLSVELPQHGYGHNGERLWEGKNDLKFGIAGVAEIGALFGLSRRVDLTLGVTADYGFMDIQKRQDDFIGPVPGTTQQAGSFIAENVYYNGTLNSTQVSKINPLSVRGKIGIRVKLGKLSPKKQLDTTSVVPESPVQNTDSLEKAMRDMQRLLEELARNREETNKNVTVKGVVLDAQSRSPLSATVEITAKLSDKIVAAAVSDPATGSFSIDLPPGEDYTINVNKEGYIYYTDDFEIKEKDKGSTINKVIVLDKIAVDKTVVLKNIFFDFNKATLRPESMIEIDKIYRLMVDNPTIELEISGHTDNIGSASVNKSLSSRRAEAVVNELVRRGIDKDRLVSRGYGFDRPAQSNDTAEGRAQNRRTEFKIIKE